MKPEDIIAEGKKTAAQIKDEASKHAKEFGDTVHEGLSHHGIDTDKLGDALMEDAKNAGNFVVGSAKIAADKLGDIVNGDHDDDGKGDEKEETKEEDKKENESTK